MACYTFFLISVIAISTSAVPTNDKITTHLNPVQSKVAETKNKIDKRSLGISEDISVPAEGWQQQTGSQQEGAWQQQNEGGWQQETGWQQEGAWQQQNEGGWQQEEAWKQDSGWQPESKVVAKTITVTKQEKVPYPVPYPVAKHVPYEVKVPYPVVVEKKIPYPVKVPVHVPHTVTVEKPYKVYKPIYIEKKVHVPHKIIVEKKVPVFIQQQTSHSTLPILTGNIGLHLPLLNTLPIVNSNLPILGNNIPILGSSFPILGNNLPILGNNFPILGNNLPILGNNLPILGNNLPILNNNLPIFGNNVPLGGIDLSLLGGGLPIATGPAPILDDGLPRGSGADGLDNLSGSPASILDGNNAPLVTQLALPVDNNDNFGVTGIDGGFTSTGNDAPLTDSGTVDFTNLAGIPQLTGPPNFRDLPLPGTVPGRPDLG